MIKICKNSVLTLAACLMGILALGACSATPTATVEPTEDVPTLEATEVVLVEEPTPTATPEEISECVECHQDKQRLIDTAAEEEEVEEENSGQG